MTKSQVEQRLGAKYVGSAKISRYAYFMRGDALIRIKYSGVYSSNKRIGIRGKGREIGFVGLDFQGMQTKPQEEGQQCQ